MQDLLIDLDNTVYPENSNIFSLIDIRMKSFISKNLNVSLEKSYEIQKKYFMEHGTTLKGLMLHHNINPKPFLSYVHDIDLSSIQNNPKLIAVLKKYKGKKIIFTNGSQDHAIKVLQRIGIKQYINGIFDIIDAEYIPKPEIVTYKKVLKKFNLIPEKTIMIDDLPINLKTAKKLGINTVLINQKHDTKNNHNYINLVCSNILETIIKINEGKINESN
jgi:putative hydrolase of the HAD superfamily